MLLEHYIVDTIEALSCVGMVIPFIILLESHSAIHATVIVASPQHIPGLNHDANPPQPHVVETPALGKLARRRRSTQ